MSIASPVPGTRPAPRSTESATRETHPHLSHILAHFQRIKGGQMTVLEPGEVFLGHVDGTYFWELIGLRISGHPGPILGCMRFRRHEFPGKTHARETLAAYLSRPPTGILMDGMAVPDGAVPMLLPRTTESVPAFLGNLRAGVIPDPVHLDPAAIEVAWDFRTYNPYGIESMRHRAAALRDRLVRTQRGHVVRGLSHELIRPEETRPRFLAVKEPIQITPKGRITLPSLALNQTFLAMAVDISDQTTRLAAPNWFPFSRGTAEKRHLLLG